MNTFRRPSLLRWLKGVMLKRLHRMITCREFEDFVGAYFDDTLDSKRRSIFELHLRLCRECRDYLDAYRRATQLGQRVFEKESETVPDEVPDDLVEAILAARES